MPSRVPKHDASRLGSRSEDGVPGPRLSRQWSPEFREEPFSLNTLLTYPTDRNIISCICRGLRMSRWCETENLSRPPMAHVPAPQAALGTAPRGTPKRPNRMYEALRAKCYSRRIEQTYWHSGLSRGFNRDRRLFGGDVTTRKRWLSLLSSRMKANSHAKCNTKKDCDRHPL